MIWRDQRFHFCQHGLNEANQTNLSAYQKKEVNCSNSGCTHASILPEIFSEHVFLNNNKKCGSDATSVHIHILLQFLRQQQHQLLLHHQ